MKTHELIIYSLAFLNIVVLFVEIFLRHRWFKFISAGVKAVFVGYITYLFIDYTHWVNTVLTFLFRR